MSRVVLTGGPGAGKTTLLATLAAMGFTTVEESARAIIAERLARGGWDYSRQARTTWWMCAAAEMLARALWQLGRQADARTVWDEATRTAWRAGWRLVHAQLRADFLDMAVSVRAGPDHFLKRNDVGANLAEHVRDPVRASAPIDAARAMDVVGDNPERRPGFLSHYAMIDRDVARAVVRRARADPRRRRLCRHSPGSAAVGGRHPDC